MEEVMFNKVVRALQKAQITVGGVFLGIFLVAVVVQIAARYAGVSLIWTEDVSLYSFIWAVFMGAAAMVYERRHFAFTSLSDFVRSPAGKFWVSIAISAIILIFSFFMLYYGIRIAKQFWNYRWVTIPQFKRGPVWLCVPIAGATMTLYAAALILNDIAAFARRKNAGSAA
ncbi:MAG: TRAP transporter small permease subunit [Spirochaetaceae bacterium]|jgi:TRAP-type C4-dicarboxylate transport system permease small subunit|nr:TRAP transporter small permease subunit [Spirochaetaceae bacterium]